MNANRAITQNFIDAVEEYKRSFDICEQTRNYKRSLMNGVITEEQRMYTNAYQHMTDCKRKVREILNRINRKIGDSKNLKTKFMCTCEQLVFMCQHCELDIMQLQILIETYKESIIGLRKIKQYCETHGITQLLEDVNKRIQGCTLLEYEIFHDADTLTPVFTQANRIWDNVTSNPDEEIDWSILIKLDNQ